MLREYGILIFGFPARVIVWMLIAFFLGLIWTQLQFPEFWRKIFSKRHAKSIEDRKAHIEKKAQSTADIFRKIGIILLWVVGLCLFLIGIFWVVGWMV